MGRFFMCQWKPPYWGEVVSLVMGHVFKPASFSSSIMTKKGKGLKRNGFPLPQFSFLSGVVRIFIDKDEQFERRIVSVFTRFHFF